MYRCNLHGFLKGIRHCYTSKASGQNIQLWDKGEGTGMNKDLPDKQKTTSGCEWFIVKMDRGAERYPTGKRIGTGPVCSVYQ